MNASILLRRKCLELSEQLNPQKPKQAYYSLVDFYSNDNLPNPLEFYRLIYNSLLESVNELNK